MSVSRKDVEHVARLARLDLDEAEIARFERELGTIVEYVNELSGVDTNGVEPTTSVAVDSAPFRDDVVVPGIEHAAALAESPRTAEGSFAVPAIIEES